LIHLAQDMVQRYEHDNKPSSSAEVGTSSLAGHETSAVFQGVSLCPDLVLCYQNASRNQTRRGLEVCTTSGMAVQMFGFRPGKNDSNQKLYRSFGTNSFLQLKRESFQPIRTTASEVLTLFCYLIPSRIIAVIH
jgi:hypothetical protein